MADFVEITDDGSDVEIENGITPRIMTVSATSFDKLKNLKREMDFRGSILGKTWSELSKIMTDYQAELIEKHDEVQMSSSGADTNRMHKLEKQVAELEQKLLSKDSEIVRLRTEVQKLRNEVSMKDSLIQKLQAQMAQEALEFQTEVTSLKDMLESGSVMEIMNNTPGAMNSISGDMPTAKRRKHNPRPQMNIHPTSSATYPKAESSLSSCALQQPQHSRTLFKSPNRNPASSSASYLVTDDNSLEMSGETLEGNNSNSEDGQHLMTQEGLDDSVDNTFFKIEDEGDESNSVEYIDDGMEYDPNDPNASLQMDPQQQMLLAGHQQQMNAGHSSSSNQQHFLQHPLHNLYTPRKRLNQYTAEMKIAIGSFASINGTRKAARHFASVLGYDVPVSTVQVFKQLYVLKLQTGTFK